MGVLKTLLELLVSLLLLQVTKIAFLNVLNILKNSVLCILTFPIGKYIFLMEFCMGMALFLHCPLVGAPLNGFTYQDENYDTYVSHLDTQQSLLDQWCPPKRSAILNEVLILAVLYTSRLNELAPAFTLSNSAKLICLR